MLRMLGSRKAIQQNAKKNGDSSACSFMNQNEALESGKIGPSQMKAKIC